MNRSESSCPITTSVQMAAAIKAIARMVITFPSDHLPSSKELVSNPNGIYIKCLMLTLTNAVNRKGKCWRQADFPGRSCYPSTIRAGVLAPRNRIAGRPPGVTTLPIPLPVTLAPFMMITVQIYVIRPGTQPYGIRRLSGVIKVYAS